MGENFWVSDSAGDCIHIIGSNGALLRTFGRTGSGEGESSLPGGIAFDGNENEHADSFDDLPVPPGLITADADGTIYVCAPGEKAIYRFTRNAEYSETT